MICIQSLSAETIGILLCIRDKMRKHSITVVSLQEQLTDEQKSYLDRIEECSVLTENNHLINC